MQASKRSRRVASAIGRKRLKMIVRNRSIKAKEGESDGKVLVCLRCPMQIRVLNAIFENNGHLRTGL